MSYIEPGKEAIRIKRGADFSFGPFEISIYDDDTKVTTVLNLTGATCQCQVRESQDRGATLIADMTLVVTVGAVTGYLSDIELKLTDTQTAAIAQSGGWYDVLVTDASGIDTYYLEGKVTVFGSVTVKP